jgi:DNA polymerase-3 subunit alpha
MPAVALTDSASMFGALEFAEYCAKGVQPIMGCRLFSACRGRSGPARRGENPDPLVALAMDAAGLGSLQKLSSQASAG